MSGNELGTKTKASKGKVKIDGLERSELRPRLLIPTPAQQERGENRGSELQGQRSIR